MSLNYYETLGISPDATDAQIRYAYRHKAAALQANKEISIAKAASILEQLGKAQEVLLDRYKRA